jgi:hypothetical protein
MVTLYDLNKIDERGISALHRISEYCNENNVQMVVLTCLLPEEIQHFLHQNQLDDLEYYFADGTAIKTVMRSNPGFTLLKDGKVLGKWHFRKVRGIADFELN